MVYKKQGRERYYTAPTLPAFGRIGPYSTGTASKRLADQMEAMLHTLALEMPAAIRGLVQKRYTLRQLWVARQERTLEALVAHGEDPPLKEVAERFQGHVTDVRIAQGLTALVRLAPPKARRSWLLNPKHLSDAMSALVAEGQKPNSVRRGLYRAISDLLAYEVGKAEKGRILADVIKPGENDTRRVTLTAEQLDRLLAALDVQMRDMVTLAVLTGIDRGPLLALTPADFDAERGALLIPDTKTRTRLRTLELGAGAQAILRRLAAGKGATDPLFPLRRGAVESRWDAARKQAGLPWLRFKDLRHLYGERWVAAGGSMRKLKEAMGHTRIQTTERYTYAEPVADRAQMEAVEKAFGLDRQHLKLEDQA